MGHPAVLQVSVICYPAFAAQNAEWMGHPLFQYPNPFLSYSCGFLEHAGLKLLDGFDGGAFGAGMMLAVDFLEAAQG